MTWIRNNSVRLALALLIALMPVRAAAGQLDERLAALSNSGSGEATYHLGMLYHMGLGGVQRDPRKAFELFKLAADRGDPLGSYKLGCYYDGQGEGVVKDDPILALKFKLVAARAGYALAQEDVAKHFLAAHETDKALRWLEESAAQGSPMPLLVLGSLYAGLVPANTDAPKVPKDAVKGWAYMLLSMRDMPEGKARLPA